ncbi:hypothetical protein BX600DRAFT_122349 [Xylariales sp. PMI_506]|nr:hypothetical protein BX600DRAFT_122349 [Xylariales sp. PMI_506]
MEKQKSPRARYLADLQAAIESDIPNVSNVSKIDGEGELSFTYGHPALLSLHLLKIQVVPQEFSRYPHGHFFVVFCSQDDIPHALTVILNDFVATSSGMRVYDVLSTISRRFTTALEENSQSPRRDCEDFTMVDVEDDDAEPQDSEWSGDSDIDEEIDYDEDDTIFGLGLNSNTISGTPEVYTRCLQPQVLGRVRRDLRTARDAGFKVGIICGFTEPDESSIVSISVRVDKLGLSKETRNAWNLEQDDFVVLLIEYKTDYKTFEEALQQAVNKFDVRFRLRKCNKYKPTLLQAKHSFSRIDVKQQHTYRPTELEVDLNESEVRLSNFSIGQSIEAFMNSEFVPLSKLRARLGLSWEAAKRKHIDISRAAVVDACSLSVDANVEGTSFGNCATDDNDGDAKLPSFLAEDDLIDGGEASLPLVAGQFAMRYLVRCTEYCMVCHQPVEGNFQALKPYICGNSLCLFQYMALGLGPSIDQEIITQPNVVDLLISFCYAGAAAVHLGSGKGVGLRAFPTGLHLLVPNILPLATLNLPADPRAPDLPPVDSVSIRGGVLLEPMVATFNSTESTVSLRNLKDMDRIKRGGWVAVITSTINGSSIVHHGCVENIVAGVVQLHISARHALPILEGTNLEEKDMSETKSCYMVLYGLNLDDLDLHAKSFSIQILLATVPSVQSMREYLGASQDQQLEKSSLLSPAASKLLRWIVASNRSYIVQVNDYPADVNTKHEQRGEMLSGVDGWIQFRFAQGSPEKETQFQEEVKKIDKAHKTIFAWHGSSITNWHSIIREGLNFEYTLNGRAFGNGVYFALDFGLSMGYTHAHLSHAHVIWPNSSLKIATALSLNEIINRPDDFTHSKSCLVVQHTHWIQCRYLLVKPLKQDHLVSTANKAAVTQREDEESAQDPEFWAKGPTGTKIFIPRATKESSKVELDKETRSEESEVEDAEDLSFLDVGDDGSSAPKALSDNKEAGERMPAGDEKARQSQTTHVDASKTDFRPGTLDTSTLPRLNPPSYATELAQKTIAREVKKLQKVQSVTPVDELGWYIDFGGLTNMFQWIVELHSFDSDLPLAKDMKSAGLTSIILELRFGRNFPLSPPFVRVVRPRFLPFMNGGGGHVTAGGALCMELLTNSGWSPATSLESVLLQVRMALCSLDPQPARLQSTSHTTNRMNYGISEAFDAYSRAATAHGWPIPSDLHETITGMNTAN